MRSLGKLAAAAVLLTGVLHGAVAAQPTLVRSRPPSEQVDRGSTLTLVFDQVLMPRRTHVRLSNAAGEAIPVRLRFSATGRSFTVEPLRSLAGGAYRVDWRALGRRGPPAEGSYEIVVR